MKTKTEKRKNAVIIIVMILLIMCISFGFRYLVNRKVVTDMGEYYQDYDAGVPYLTEMDSYYHQRMTRDIEIYGHAGDCYNADEEWDSLSYAPEGRSAAGYQPLMAYIAIGVHKISSLFGDVNLEKITYWMAPFVSALVIIPVFLFVLRLQGVIAASVAAVLSAINYGYFVHTVPGFYDTDMVISWTSAFLFFFGCLFIESLSGEKDDGKEKKTVINGKTIIYFILFIISLLLLMASWYVYYMFAGIFAFSVVVYVILKTLLTEKETRSAVFKDVSPMLVFAIAFGVIILIANPSIIKDSIGTVKSVFTSGKSDLFPNAYVSVAEMRTPKLIAGGFSGLFQMRVLSGSDIGIINAVGGMIPCLAATAMAVLLVIDIVKKRFRFTHILLVVWFLATAVLAVRSWRFIMLFALPVAILTGLFTGKICNLMRDKKMMDWQAFAALIVMLMLFPAIYGAYRSAGDSLPSVNTDMHASLDYINENADPDAVLVSWWDYGYFYEEKGNRGTLFDGGSQNGQRIYWVSRAFASTNETLSANIIRMLAGSGDEGTNMMLNIFGEEKSTLELIENMLSKDRENAKKLLSEKGLSQETCNIILDLMYPEDGGDPILIITRHMSGISGWFSRFGYADDPRYGNDAYSIVIDRTQYDPGQKKTGWTVDIGGESANVIIENDNGEYKAYSEKQGSDEQPFVIEKILLKENGIVQEIPMEDADKAAAIKYTVVIDLDSYSPSASMVTSLLADSVFGKLYYMDGRGLEEFKRDNNAPGSSLLYTLN